MRKGSEVEEERGVGGAEVRDGNIAGMKHFGGKTLQGETGPANAALPTPSPPLFLPNFTPVSLGGGLSPQRFARRRAGQRLNGSRVTTDTRDEGCVKICRLAGCFATRRAGQRFDGPLEWALSVGRGGRGGRRLRDGGRRMRGRRGARGATDEGRGGPRGATDEGTGGGGGYATPGPRRPPSSSPSPSLPPSLPPTSPAPSHLRPVRRAVSRPARSPNRGEARGGHGVRRVGADMGLLILCCDRSGSSSR